MLLINQYLCKSSAGSSLSVLCLHYSWWGWEQALKKHIAGAPPHITFHWLDALPKTDALMKADVSKHVSLTFAIVKNMLWLRWLRRSVFWSAAIPESFQDSVGGNESKRRNVLRGSGPVYRNRLRASVLSVWLSQRLLGLFFIHFRLNLVKLVGSRVRTWAIDSLSNLSKFKVTSWVQSLSLMLMISIQYN